MVVVLTVLVLGGLTPYMLRWLGLVSEDPHAEGKAGHPTVGAVASTGEGATEGIMSPGSAVPGEGYGMVETQPEVLDEEAQALQGPQRSAFFAWLYQLDAK